MYESSLDGCNVHVRQGICGSYLSSFVHLSAYLPLLPHTSRAAKTMDCRRRKRVALGRTSMMWGQATQVYLLHLSHHILEIWAYTSARLFGPREQWDTKRRNKVARPISSPGIACQQDRARLSSLMSGEDRLLCRRASATASTPP
jgi:hypothetical protein